MDHEQGTPRGMRLAIRLTAVAAVLGLPVCVLAGTTTSAFADSTAYELYCPGTPVGTVVLNDVKTTATITPASPAAGSTFQVTNYQTIANLPGSLASAAAALGNASVQGSATATLNATGATPASLPTPSLNFNVPIPSPVPASGLALDLPSPAGSVGPFTASGGAITISQASKASLTLTVSGNPLSLNCTAYNNDAIPTSGITTATPSGSPISPQIATASAGGGGGGTPSTSPPTTAAPATAASSLATTGAGPGIYLLAEIGIAGLVAAALLTLGYRLRLRTATAGASRDRRSGG